MTHETTTTISTPDGFALSARHGTVPHSRGLLVLLHGITVDMHEHGLLYDDIVSDAQGNGFDTLRVDFRGHGGSAGTNLDFSVSGQFIDVFATIATGLKLTNESMPVHLVACSFGAMPALWAGAQFPDNVRTIFLLSPVLDYVRTFLQPETEWAKRSFGGHPVADVMGKGAILLDEAFRVSPRLVAEMSVLSPAVLLPQLKCRTRVVHGLADSMVPVDATIQAAKGTPAELILIEGMDHGFVAAGDEQGEGPQSQRFRQQIRRSVLELIQSRT